MDDLDECIHGLGPVSACTTCNGRDVAEALVPEWHVFDAKYPGWCAACHLAINVGDPIGWAVGCQPLHERCMP